MWPMVARVLDPRSDLHGEVVAFTERGESLRSLPGLKSIAGAVLGIPVTERSVEAKHRLNRLATSRAPHASGAFVNVHLKLPDLRRALRDEPALLGRLSETVELTRTSPEKLVDAFSLRAHPTIMAEMEKKGRVRSATVKDAIHRLDSKTQHQLHVGLVGAAPSKPKPPTGPKDCLNHGLRHLSIYSLQHFRKTCRYG